MNWLENRKNFFLTIVILLLLTIAVRLLIVFFVFYYTNFPIQRYDAYIYVLKAFEILRGDWTPIRTHAIGWPAFLAFFFYFFHGPSIFENFLYGIFFTVVVSSMVLVPLALMSKLIFRENKYTIVALATFAFNLFFILPEAASVIILSEPLFTLIFLFALYFLFLAIANRPVFLLFASATAGLAYYVRPNGLFLLPIVLLTYYFGAEHRNKKFHLIIALTVFFAVSAPFLYHRYLHFGSLFDYAENSDFLAASYTNAWGSYYPRVKLTQYLSNLDFRDLIKRFFFGGLVLTPILFFYVTLPNIFLFLGGLITNLKNKKFLPILITFIIWLIGLIPVFYIYYNPRHLLPLVPLAILITTAFLKKITENQRGQNIFLIIFLIAQALFSIVAIATMVFAEKGKAVIIRDALTWTPAVSTLAKGKLAMGAGSDILMAALSDTRIGGLDMLNLTAPQSNLQTVFPGEIKDIQIIMPWLKKKKIDYILIDDISPGPLMILPDKYLLFHKSKDLPTYFQEIYSNYQTNSLWKVRLFKINWKEYER